MDALPERHVDRSQMLMLGGAMRPYVWTINGAVSRPRDRRCRACAWPRQGGEGQGFVQGQTGVSRERFSEFVVIIALMGAGL